MSAKKEGGERESHSLLSDVDAAPGFHARQKFGGWWRALPDPVYHYLTLA